MFAGARLAKQVTVSERRLAALREAYTAGQAALAAAADRVEIVSNTLGKSREDGAAAAAANQLTRSGVLAEGFGVRSGWGCCEVAGRHVIRIIYSRVWVRISVSVSRSIVL